MSWGHLCSGLFAWHAIGAGLAEPLSLQVSELWPKACVYLNRESHGVIIGRPYNASVSLSATGFCILSRRTLPVAHSHPSSKLSPILNPS